MDARHVLVKVLNGGKGGGNKELAQGVVDGSMTVEDILPRLGLFA